jgi:UDP-N-acetylglucosamine:LPS N-acetylglucosamine transferase
MYHVHNLKQAVPDAEHPYDFPLDPFQRHALHAIANNENVLVTAKTGSGKTLVGEYQIYHSLKKGKRVFYTTPIKSLTNQKFHDLKKMYPSVGIMTGDIKFCPQADIVVCRAGASTVTEIAAVGAAALFVPFPHAVDDHQTTNAAFLVQAGAAWCVPQTEFTPQALAERLRIVQRSELLAMAERAQTQAKTDAVDTMVQACEALTGGTSS